MSETREDTTGAAPALAPAVNIADANTADNNPAVLLAEDVPEDESDRGESIASSSTSVTESVLEYRIENGRTYHKYKDGKYHLPNDERENDRLDIQHNMWLLTFDNRLGTAPPNDPNSKVGRVLDVGTGTGIWAMEFGEEHPNAEILGVDLSAIQPDFTPPNVKFQIDDIEEPWTYSQPFDYIHSRTMTFSVADWKEYIQKCYDNLSPNGYLELNEVDLWPKSDDETLKDNSAVLKFVRLWAEAAVMFGRPFQDIRVLKDIMIEIGFKDVYAQMFKWPTNSWPKDRKHRELGFWNHDNFCAGLEGFMMAPLTRAHNWTKEEVTVFGMQVRNDMRNRNIHAYSAVWSIYGRKPGNNEA
ncbi:methyltransferase domain-containing protein [Colletotrichum kahawae]|uniref:Methyltransferase domain-containing protein n=1 Tax=Colletotrichum kahawae TaxID=34407 RepID=A0AAD9Y0R7_COLKA|nr:methyltransferase domain-containing protein [Colletotrichum kahawae]